MGMNSAPQMPQPNEELEVPQENESTVETAEKKKELERLIREAAHSIEAEYSVFFNKELNGYEANRASWIATFPPSLEEFTQRLTEGGIEARLVDRMKNLKEVQEYYKLRETIQ